MDWYQCVAWLDRGGLCLLLRANVDHVLVTNLEEGFSVALRVTTGPREDRLEILQSLDRPETARFFWFPSQVVEKTRSILQEDGPERGGGLGVPLHRAPSRDRRCGSPRVGSSLLGPLVERDRHDVRPRN